MYITTKKATGMLANMLANIDEKELARTRKRMMLAAKIEDAMKKRGLTQTQFAQLMHNSPAVISEWLSGDRNFTTDTLSDIEQVLGVQLLNVSVVPFVSTDAAAVYK